MEMEFTKIFLQKMTINDLKGIKEDLEDLNRMGLSEKDSLIEEIIALRPDKNKTTPETVEQWENRTGEIYPEFHFVFLLTPKTWTGRVAFAFKMKKTGLEMGFPLSEMFVIEPPKLPANHHGKPEHPNG